MKKFFKWMGFVVAGLVGVALLGFAYIYFASERVLDRKYAVADHAALVLPTEAVEIAEGQRIAQIGGCLHCHGEKLTGGVVEDIPNLVRMVAPNVSVMLPGYSDTQLATVLRKGVKPDGTSVLFMPSEMFRHLSDADLARLIAYLRTVPAPPRACRTKRRCASSAAYPRQGRLQAGGARDRVTACRDRSFDVHDPVSRGRYLTMNLAANVTARTSRARADRRACTRGGQGLFRRAVHAAHAGRCRRG